jgi:hypothetical protein
MATADELAAKAAAAQERADRLTAEAERRSETAHNAYGRFAGGQPLLIGHHSYRSALRDRRRADAASDLALAAYEENTRLLDEQATALDAETDAATIKDATAYAKRILGNDVALDFDVIDAPSPDGIAAEAEFPGRPGFGIRFTADDETALYLIRPCAHCGHVREDRIRSLPGLGELLAEGPTR